MFIHTSTLPTTKDRFLGVNDDSLGGGEKFPEIVSQQKGLSGDNDDENDESTLGDDLR